MRPLLAASLFFAAVFVAPVRAEPVVGAAALERVTLQDGSIYQGELVEKVVGDHVTLKLATGEVKRIEWKAMRLEPTEPARRPEPLEPPEPNEPPPPPGIPTGEQDADAYGNTGFVPDGPREVPTPREYAQPQGDDLQDWAWPRPMRLDGKRLYVGIGIGWDFPYAFPGDLVIGFEPAAWFAVELAGRYGNPFGPSIGEMVRFALPLFDAGRIGVGLGLRQSFLTFSGPPPVAHFFDAELFGDTFFTKNLMLRTMVGFGTLLNGGAYDVLCSGLPYPDCYDFQAAGDPYAAAQGQRLFTYAKIQLIWQFGL